MRFLSRLLVGTLLAVGLAGCLEDVDDPRPGPNVEPDGGAFEPGEKPPTGNGYGYGGSGSGGSGSGGSGSGARKSAKPVVAPGTPLDAGISV